VIEGNFIGTDPSGSQGPSNFDYGVTVFGNSSDNTIGGKAPAARNLISGNSFRGLNIFGSGGNTIQGNLIGTKANGTEPMGNGLAGVEIFSPNNTVGGDDAISDNAGEANRIAFNGGDGVRVLGGRGNTFAIGNRILNNSIYSNGNLGIDLDGGPPFSNPDADGVTANDRRDRDMGPNTLQNFPRLASATTDDLDITIIKGRLNSRPRKTFFIQFFSSETKNSAGFAEGKTFVGQLTKKTNREGKLSFTLRTVLAPGENLVTATATSLDTSTTPPSPLNTSEFSRAVTAKPAP
jgi:parallel beta-helix repeat protein